MRPFVLAPTAWLGGWVVRALSSAARLELDPESQARLETAGEPAILTYWHEHIFVSTVFLRRFFLSRRRPLAALASHSQDGELVARIARNFGVRVARGSTSRGGREGLRALHRELVKHGASLVILPDGPRGPRHEVKPGLIVLSQLSGAPVVPLAFAASRAWRLRSWDRMAVPKPGCRVRVLVGEPIRVPRELGDEEREHYRLGIASTLLDLGDLVAPLPPGPGTAPSGGL
ncbi:MAG TPA: lysophospholipid acyltransferase family protein [Thermoanaerobaculia bacterium]|nr:lysophospholipid acyltransferase family protein [Thermoanaerobaculia bacterium]